MYILLFDIDGTLISSGGAGKAAMEAALRAEFSLHEIRDGVPFSGRTDRAIGHELLHLHDIPVGVTNWHRLRTGYLSHLPGTLASHKGHIYPGIMALLEHLGARRDVAVGLLTGNIADGARLKLGHYGLMHHFAFGGFGDEHLSRDDVAHEALAAATRYVKRAVSPSDIWVLGDTPLDVRCARAIGAHVAAVATGWHSREELAAAEPDLLFTDLADFTRLVAHLP